VSAARSMRLDRRIVGRQVREIDLDPGLPQHRQRVLQRRHHAQASRSTLMIPRSAQSSLSHWITMRPGMVRRLERDDLVEPPLREHHAAECWPRCRGRSWISSKRRAKRRIRRSPWSRPARASRAASVSSGSTVLEASASAARRFDLSPPGSRAPCDLARGAAVAVGDHVRCHQPRRQPVTLVRRDWITRSRLSLARHVEVRCPATRRAPRRRKRSNSQLHPDPDRRP